MTTRSPVDRLRASALGLRDFRLLWAGQAVSTVGDQIFPVAVTIAVLDATGNDASAVGAVLAARWLALVTFVLVGGLWADRLPRRAVMIAADAFRAACVGGLALTTSAPPLWFLALLVFLVGGGEAFFRPAYGALVPAVVPEDRRTAANALTSVSWRTAAIVGPAVGAALVTAVGVRAAFALDALTFVISLVTLLRVREPPRDRLAERNRSAMRELGEGFAAVWAQRWAAAVLVVAALQLMLVVAPETVLLPIVARREFGPDELFGGGDALFGAALSAMSAGGLLCAVVAMRIRPRHPAAVAVLGLLPFALVPLALLLPISPWWLIAAYFVAGAGLEPFIIYWTDALQREFPPHQLARVTSIDWLCSFALMPLGLALTGPAVNAVGESAVLVTGIAVQVATVYLLLLVPGIREFREPRLAAVAGHAAAASRDALPAAEAFTFTPVPRVNEPRTAVDRGRGD